MYGPVREFDSTALDLTAKCLVDFITCPHWFVLKGGTHILKVVHLCVFEAFLDFVLEIAETLPSFRILCASELGQVGVPCSHQLLGFIIDPF